MAFSKSSLTTGNNIEQKSYYSRLNTKTTRNNVFSKAITKFLSLKIMVFKLHFYFKIPLAILHISALLVTLLSL